MNTTGKGRTGEDLAEQFLVEKGVTVLKRNFKCPAGEVDIIGKKDDVLCFYEIKNWDAFDFDQLEYAIDSRKQSRIIKCSRYYMRRNASYRRFRIQYDVLFFSREGEVVKHVEHAFTETGWA